MQSGDGALRIGTRPSVILLIGVNGVGKTTAAAKLCVLPEKPGQKVLFAAADTFPRRRSGNSLRYGRNASVWTLSATRGATPPPWYSTRCRPQKARGTDVIICDTAGRLHNKST